jgi:hypothetical protein
MHNVPRHPTRSTALRYRWTMLLLTLASACLAILPPGLSARDRRLPRVPSELTVPAGHRLFLLGHATGTQQYICLPTSSGVAWTLFGPQATLFSKEDHQIVTHFLSPNPDEGGMARATWQHSRDSSTVWAQRIATSSDPHFVGSDAIPWLLLQVVGAEEGPTGGHRLTGTTHIQRIHTSGGQAPISGCTQTADVGKSALVPYTADYLFYQ